MSELPRPNAGGYGNIYTPRAGSMIIQVQRESGLANRTIILSQRQVRMLHLALYLGAVLLVVGGMSWVFLASQAARVPLLTRRVTTLQHDVRRLDTLQAALHTLERRFQHVQLMLGASPSASMDRNGDPGEPAPVGGVAGIPTVWPVATAGELLPSTDRPGAAPRPGVDVAVPVGTPIRAAGAGTVVEITDHAPDGKRVRLAHRDGYETLYAHLSEILVKPGDRVAAGAVIARSGTAQPSAAPRLRFEIYQAGVAMDPLRIRGRE